MGRSLSQTREYLTRFWMPKGFTLTSASFVGGVGARGEAGLRPWMRQPWRATALWLKPASGPFQRDVLYPLGTGTDCVDDRNCTCMITQVSSSFGFKRPSSL